MFQAILSLFLVQVLVAQGVVLIEESKLSPEAIYAQLARLAQLNLTNTLLSKSQRIHNQRYLCYIPIANDLLCPNNTYFTSLNTSAINAALAKQYLAELGQLCAVYRTKQFLYEVCYQEYVRQFDDATTIFNMGKQQPENIVMGVYQHKKQQQADFHYSQPKSGATPRDSKKREAMLQHNRQPRQQSAAKTTVATASPTDLYFVIADGVGRINFVISNFLDGTKFLNLYDLTIRCSSGVLLETQVLFISESVFYLGSSYRGYCFARAAQALLTRKVIKKDSRALYGSNLWFGNCPASTHLAGSYLFIFNNSTILPVKVQQQLNKFNYVLQTRGINRKSIDHSSFRCVDFSLKQGQGLVQIKSALRTSGKFLNADLAKLPPHQRPELGDEIIMVYTTEHSHYIERLRIVGKLSQTIFIMSSGLSLEHQLVVQLTAYKIVAQVSQHPQAKDTVDLQTDILNKTPNKLPFYSIRLKPGQKLKLPNKSTGRWHLEIQGETENSLITLKQSNNNSGWIYILKDKSLKMKSYQNGSKEIVKQNRYYENITHIKTVFHVTSTGVWKEGDPLKFSRLQIDQEFDQVESIASNIHIKIFDLSKGKEHIQNELILFFWNVEQNQYLKETKPRVAIPQDAGPVLVQQKYTDGQFCGEPFNKKRSTIVKYVCGDSWFSILKVREIVPCEYELVVETRLLCPSGFQKRIEKDQSLDVMCISTVQNKSTY